MAIRRYSLVGETCSGLALLLEPTFWRERLDFECERDLELRELSRIYLFLPLRECSLALWSCSSSRMHRA
jgi:hypothetical protein